ncbi:WhiB family transcriptional regulator [Nonomuraea wenchangensis]|uniref:WhiB family transcriptional regulator n=1 Tax=Nonomuraea wenchangensis TaxID=568860 RepID=UPI00332AD8E9
MAVPDWNWMRRAACAGESLELFFGFPGESTPEKDRRERKAKAICSGCTVRPACADYALSRPERYGLWAGLNEDERASERRRRMRRANMAGVTACDPEDESDDKRCTGCGELLPTSEFYRDFTKEDCLSYWCRSCQRERRKQEVA